MGLGSAAGLMTDDLVHDVAEFLSPVDLQAAMCVTRLLASYPLCSDALTL